MHFNEWLNEFVANISSDERSSGIYTVGGALNRAYSNLRHPVEPYKTINGKGKELEGEAALEYVQKVVDFASKPAKRLSGKIKIYSQKGWHHRSLDAPRDRNKEPGLHLSLNVYPSAKLVKELDGLLLKDKNRELIYSYKLPSDPNRWDMRHDPITIYMFKDPKALLAEIARIAKPYVRSDIKMIGKEVAPGLWLTDDPTAERKAEIMKRAEKITPKFAGEIRDEYTDTKNRIALSAGEYYVLDKFLDAIKFAKATPGRIDPQSAISYRDWQAKKLARKDYAHQIWSSGIPLSRKVAIFETEGGVRHDEEDGRPCLKFFIPPDRAYVEEMAAALGFKTYSVPSADKAAAPVGRIYMDDPINQSAIERIRKEAETEEESKSDRMPSAAERFPYGIFVRGDAERHA